MDHNLIKLQASLAALQGIVSRGQEQYESSAAAMAIKYGEEFAKLWTANSSKSAAPKGTVIGPAKTTDKKPAAANRTTVFAKRKK